MRNFNRAWLPPLIIAVLTSLTFLPVLSNQFVRWDDYDNLVQNQNYGGLGWTELKWMFTTFHGGNYRALTWMAFGFDSILWGMDPRGYHLTSLLIHSANAVLVYFIALRLLRFSNATKPESAALGAAFAALLFAIHPLRVEPVAWLSARNHLLAGLFFLGTIYCYLRSISDGRRWLAVAVALYGLSLLSQPSGITLPFVLLVLDVYPLRRRAWWEKLPFVLLALGGAVLAFLVKQGGLSVKELGGLPYLAQALYKIAFYIEKTAVPVGLSPIYTLPVHLNPWDWPFVLSAIGVLGITVSTFLIRKRCPAILASWVCYLVIIIPYVFFLPLMGTRASTEMQVATDRYSYLACVSWAVLAGGALLYSLRARVQTRRERRRKSSIPGETTLRKVGLVMAALVLIVLASFSWMQAQIWHDTGTLFTYVLKKNPSSWIAYGNLGNFFDEQGKYAEAIWHYHKALAIEPNNAALVFNLARTHNGLGMAKAKLGQLDQALEEFRTAQRLNFPEAFHNMGVVYAWKSEWEEAVRSFHQASILNPDNVETRLALIKALERQRQQKMR